MNNEQIVWDILAFFHSSTFCTTAQEYKKSNRYCFLKYQDLNDDGTSCWWVVCEYGHL